MIIATLKEIKDNENRVGLTPSGVKEIKKFGHHIIVQKKAGEGAGFSDSEYLEAGCELMDEPLEIVQKADIVVKVKEPLSQEYSLLDNMIGKTLFTYLHLSGVDPKLTIKLMENSITAIAYETVEDENGKLPLLAPMSDIAGVLAIQYGAEYLQKKYHGRGITLGDICNTEPANIVIVGAGHVGIKAAKTAGGMGSKVILFDVNEKVIEKAKEELSEYLGPNLSKNVRVIKNEENIFIEAIKNADLLIGAVLVAGTKAPEVVKEHHIKLMKKGSVIVDVSIDQGGCIWGSRATSHSHPIYEIDGKIYCCVANMPGQVARQSTQALTNAKLPYLLKMANQGIIQSLHQDYRFARGLNTYQGNITYESVAKDLQMEDKFI